MSCRHVIRQCSRRVFEAFGSLVRSAHALNGLICIHLHEALMWFSHRNPDSKAGSLDFRVFQVLRSWDSTSPTARTWAEATRTVPSRKKRSSTSLECPCFQLELLKLFSKCIAKGHQRTYVDAYRHSTRPSTTPSGRGSILLAPVLVTTPSCRRSTRMHGRLA